MDKVLSFYLNLIIIKSKDMVETIKGKKEPETPKQNIFLTKLEGDSDYTESERCLSAKTETKELIETVEK